MFCCFLRRRLVERKRDVSYRRSAEALCKELAENRLSLHCLVHTVLSGRTEDTQNERCSGQTREQSDYSHFFLANRRDCPTDFHFISVIRLALCVNSRLSYKIAAESRSVWLTRRARPNEFDLMARNSILLGARRKTTERMTVWIAFEWKV